MNYLVRSQSKRRHSFTDSLMFVTSTGSLHFAWTLFFAYGRPTSVSVMPHDPPGTSSIPEKYVCLYQNWATSGDRRRRQTPHNAATEYQFIMSRTVAEVLLKPDVQQNTKAVRKSSLPKTVHDASFLFRATTQPRAHIVTTELLIG